MNSNAYTRSVILNATRIASIDTVLEAARLLRMQGHHAAADALIMQMDKLTAHAAANTEWADKLVPSDVVAA